MGNFEYTYRMLKKIFIYLLRAGVGFYFLYPAVQDFMKGSPKLSNTIFSCISTYFPQFSSQNVWIMWTILFVVLGLMIAFWKTPLSWIILGLIILIFKLITASSYPLSFLIQIVPVFLVSIALAIYYAKNEFGHR